MIGLPCRVVVPGLGIRLLQKAGFRIFLQIAHASFQNVFIFAEIAEGNITGKAQDGQLSGKAFRSYSPDSPRLFVAPSQCENPLCLL